LPGKVFQVIDQQTELVPTGGIGFGVDDPAPTQFDIRFQLARDRLRHGPIGTALNPLPWVVIY
jgi:hypothetical protein